jgi:Rod binding domain-containing protein
MAQPVSSHPAPLRPVDPADHRRTSVGPLRPVSEASVDSKLKAACEDLEALFIHQLLSEMRKTIAKSGLIDGGRSEEIYTSLMDAELAKEMAHSGGLGLSVILQEQLGGFSARPRGASRKR